MTDTNPFSLIGYSIVSTLYSTNHTQVFRAIREVDQQSVAIKVLTETYPTFHELLQFRNQYTIGKQLNHPGLVRMEQLVDCGNGQALVMEDVSSLSLAKYVRQEAQEKRRLSVIEVLSIGVQMADVLHYLSQQRVIHKDIKPANILIHPQSKQIRLIDFSIASLLPRETQEIKNPNGLEGTLAYLSPEQTGRMNRGVDYRSDFYALGVTLFELLTGVLPFQAEEPMAWVHCHIAKRPPLASDRTPMPPEVAAIVYKLMAKNAEDRYQSAFGLKHDLETCLHQLKDTGLVAPFEIGQQDVNNTRFIVPEKLYGRETETQHLLAAFDRVANGSSEVMLVAGFSGIGKTAVVNEVHKPITSKQGYFIKGKFDQFNRNVPLSAFIQSLRHLIGQLLSESDEQLAQWKNNILTVVGDNGQVLIDVIPELESIIGSQPPSASLSGVAAQNRFNALLQAFIALFASVEHPLVLFLDDLQWSDSTSLQLIELLLQDQPYFLLLGAYRDNEVSPTHPFIVTVEGLKKSAVTVNTITLGPLASSDLNRLVAETLHCSLPHSRPLTELITTKTQGNPFFSTQFLKALYADGLITFNSEQHYWVCDIAQIRVRSLTNDVVELMAQQLKKLPVATQEVLKLAACVGNQFDLATLAIISKQSQTDTALAVWKALQEGLILPQSEVYKFYVGNVDSSTDSNPAVEGRSAVGYRFLHDRVQQAAYSLIPEEDKQATHLKIGQLLLAKIPPGERQEKCFDIVNHFNMGRTLITQRAEYNELIELNLAAGQKAKASTAYSSAIDYFSIGIELLTPDCWQSQYALTLSLHEEIAEAMYLNGDFQSFDTIVQVALQSATTLLDKITTYELQIQARMAQNLMLEAIETALQVLKQLGIQLPKTPNMAQTLLGLGKTKLTLAGKNTQDLVNLPTMIDSAKLAAMRILSSALSAAFIGAPKLLPLLVFQQINLSVKYGNMPLSAFAYAWYGSILCGVLVDVDGGYEFGQLTLALVERFHADNLRCKTGFIVNAFINHWKQPFALTPPKLQAAYQSGIETGDVEYAAWAAVANGMHSYWVGDNLSDLAETLQHYEAAVKQTKQNNALVYINTYRQAAYNLMGYTEADPSILAGPYYSEGQDLPRQVNTGDRTGLFLSYINQLQLRYLFGNFSSAMVVAKSFREYEDAGMAILSNVPFYLYESLTYLAVAETAPKGERTGLLKQVTKNQKKLKKWASFAPMNTLHKWHLVEAERHRVLGQHQQAIVAYNLAITGAQKHDFTSEEALAYELAAQFYVTLGQEETAATHMQTAYYSYVRWGAKAKTDDLEKRYPNLLTPILQKDPQPLPSLEAFATIAAPNFVVHPNRTATRSSSTTINASLDFSAVLQASQLLSSTIELDSLLRQLTQIILQNSGADRCILIRPNPSNHWCVEAIATATTFELSSEPIETSLESPFKLIQYVKNSQSVVMIDDLETDLPVLDETLQRQQPRSLLCLPILNQGHLLGVLYLRNQSTSNVFTDDRVLILNFLCTQAAISLENARLYQQAQAYAQQLEESQLKTVQSEKMASLGNLVAGVAHEINNPIGFLNGSIKNAHNYLQDLQSQLDLYKQQHPDAATPVLENAEEIDLEFVCEDFPKLLNSMKGATDRIKSISTSLRTFSRADTEHKVSAHLIEGLDSTLLILKYRLKADENRPAIKVVKDYGELPRIDCFPGRLNQVFMNLLANAIDVFDEAAQQSTFAELKNKPHTITVTTAVLSDEKAVEIRIGDNGKGMPEAVKARIFDHLFTTKEVGKGTGLGLAITQQIIVEAHGGTIDVQSELGQGTEFCIRLPF